MPYKMMNVNGNRYKVYNTETGRVAAKSTSKTNAKRQIRLLYCIKAGGCKGKK